MTKPSIEAPTFPEDEQASTQNKTPMDTAESLQQPPKTSSRSPWLISGLLLGFMLGSIATVSIIPYLPLNIVNQLHLPTITMMEPQPSPPPELPTATTQNALTDTNPQAKPSVDIAPNMNIQGIQHLQASMDALQQRLEHLPSLQEGISTLSQDLQTMHQQQALIRAAQSSVESMQLHSRLSWVLHPSSHLPQIRLAWEEIVLLPSLSPEQHQQSNAMLTLAQQRLEDIDHWQRELDRVLASYPTTATSSHNIIADWLPNDGVLSPINTWLSQHFHLQKAEHPDAAVQALRQQILAIQQDMSLEKWPDAKQWKLLRSRLQLHMLHDDAQHQALSLPEDFSSVQADIERLRQTARQWLQESSK